MLCILPEIRGAKIHRYTVHAAAIAAAGRCDGRVRHGRLPVRDEGVYSQPDVTAMVCSTPTYRFRFRFQAASQLSKGFDTNGGNAAILVRSSTTVEDPLRFLLSSRSLATTAVNANFNALSGSGLAVTYVYQYRLSLLVLLVFIVAIATHEALHFMVLALLGSLTWQVGAGSIPMGAAAGGSEPDHTGVYIRIHVLPVLAKILGMWHIFHSVNSQQVFPPVTLKPPQPCRTSTPMTRSWGSVAGGRNRQLSSDPPTAYSSLCLVVCIVATHPFGARHQEEYRALRAREESDSQFKNSKEGGYTSQGWTHIPLVNAREPAELYESQRTHFPKTLKVPSPDVHKPRITPPEVFPPSLLYHVDETSDIVPHSEKEDLS